MTVEWCKYCGEGDGVCERCELRYQVRALVVEAENLKYRLAMAESNNPDSVLSKHNAMLMAVARAEATQARVAELERLQRNDSEHWQRDQRNLDALRAKLDRVRALLESTAMPDPDLGAAQHTERHWHSWRELADSLADLVYGESDTPTPEPPALMEADGLGSHVADLRALRAEQEENDRLTAALTEARELLARWVLAVTYGRPEVYHDTTAWLAAHPEPVKDPG